MNHPETSMADRLDADGRSADGQARAAKSRTSKRRRLGPGVLLVLSAVVLLGGLAALVMTRQPVNTWLISLGLALDLVIVAFAGLAAENASATSRVTRENVDLLTKAVKAIEDRSDRTKGEIDHGLRGLLAALVEEMRRLDLEARGRDDALRHVVERLSGALSAEARERARPAPTPAVLPPAPPPAPPAPEPFAVKPESDAIQAACATLVREIESLPFSDREGLASAVARQLVEQTRELSAMADAFRRREPVYEPDLRWLDRAVYLPVTEVSILDLPSDERGRLLPFAIRVAAAREAAQAWIKATYGIVPIVAAPGTAFDNALHLDTPSTRLRADTPERENVIYKRVATGFQKRGVTVLPADVRRYAPAHLLVRPEPIREAPDPTAAVFDRPALSEVPTAGAPPSPASEGVFMPDSPLGVGEPADDEAHDSPQALEPAEASDPVGGEAAEFLHAPPENELSPGEGSSDAERRRAEDEAANEAWKNLAEGTG